MIEALPAILAHACIAATPLAIAAMGETISQRAGVLNIGLEGYILTGAGTAFAVAAATGSGAAGVAAAIAAAAALGLIAGLAMIHARADQVVTGTAISLLAAGGTGALWAAIQDAHPSLPATAAVAPAIGGWHLPTLLAPLLVAACAWMLRRTRPGLVIAALGEDPDACAAAGIDVRRWRLAAVLAAAALGGLAGAWLSVMRTQGFQPLMSGGKGFLILCLVILGRWRPLPVAACCLGFGILDGLQQHLQAIGAGAVVPWRVLDLLPWLVALAALAIAGRAGSAPAALGRPW